VQVAPATDRVLVRDSKNPDGPALTLPIKETVDQHTETLAQHGGMLTEILRRLSNNTAD
jgi:Domain of unknown function (DUF397)